MLLGKDFIAQLCDSLTLKDISNECTAEQSSVPEWSQSDDANQILSNVDGDFGNHTDYEYAPWIKIDLKRTLNPEFIIVQNRANTQFEARASSLRVEYSTDDTNYRTIHSGSVVFGCLPDGMPLILPLKGSMEMRYLKLSIHSEKKVPLHLKRVNILIDAKPNLLQGLNSITFYSSRTDGLGERLKSLLNAMVLSNLYKSEFKFTWNNPPGLGESHAVDDANKTFSESFRNHHLIETIPEKCHELDKKPDFSSPKLEKIGAIKVSQNSIFKQIPELKKLVPRSAFRHAFEQIEFSPEIAEAISIANNIELTRNTASIHLRSGDIVYGRYRHNDRYTNKVISYAQADFMISALKKRDTKVVLFGQNSEVCRYLADKYDAIFFGDDESIANFSSLQLALFDMVLMSRTNHIIAGKSGFSQFAEIIGDARFKSPETFFDKKNMSLHIAKLLSSDETLKFDNYQNAFSCWHYVFHYKDLFGNEKVIPYLEQAIKFDENNLFYLVVLATLYYEIGKFKEAELIIDKVLSRKEDTAEEFGCYAFLVKHKHPDGTGAFRRYKKVLIEMSGSGLKGADVLVSDFFN